MHPDVVMWAKSRGHEHFGTGLVFKFTSSLTSISFILLLFTKTGSIIKLKTVAGQGSLPELEFVYQVKTILSL